MLLKRNGHRLTRWASGLGHALGALVLGKGGASAPPAKPPRVEPPFMLGEEGLEIAPPQEEPLKTAFSLDPSFRAGDLRAMREPSTLRGIERRSLFNRLEAAMSADVYLFQQSQKYLRHGAEVGSRPDSSDKLALALSVWAWSRSRLGFEDEGLIAMGKALEWSWKAGASSLRGYVYQRSARMMLDQLVEGWAWGGPNSLLGSFLFKDLLRELESARSDHMKTEPGEAAVTETTLDMGVAFTLMEQSDPGHRFLRIGLERLESGDVVDRMRQLDSRSVLARDLIRLGRVDEASSVAEELDPDLLEPRDRYLWLQLKADLHRANGRLESGFGRRLEALASCLDHCGPERILEDLVAVGRSRPESPSELSAEAERWVTEAVLRLSGRVKTETWREGIRSLGKTVLRGPGHGESVCYPAELQSKLYGLQVQLYRALREELTLGKSEEDERTTEFTDGGGS